MYYSEIGKIIEAGFEHDAEGIRYFALSLSKKLEKEGDASASTQIKSVLKKYADKTRDLKTDLLKPADDEEPSTGNTDSLTNEYSTEVPKEEKLIFPESVTLKLRDFTDTVRNREKIAQLGLDLSQSLLLYGPDGCGKKTAARNIASNQFLPIIIVHPDRIISADPGQTARNIQQVFEYAEQNPAVLFLESFDFLINEGTSHMKPAEQGRTLDLLIRSITEYSKDHILIAAAQDRSLIRATILNSFQYVIELPRPEVQEIKQMMEQLPEYFITSDISENQWKKIFRAMAGLSYADIRKIIDNLSKKAVLKASFELNMESIIEQVYLISNNEVPDRKSMAVFMLMCGVPKKRVERITGFSRRKVDQFEENMF